MRQSVHFLKREAEGGKEIHSRASGREREDERKRKREKFPIVCSHPLTPHCIIIIPGVCV